MLRFPHDIWCGVSFHVLIWRLYIFFKVSFQVFGPFFSWIIFLLLSLTSFFKNLDNNPLSDVYFVKIFFQSVSGVLILLSVLRREVFVFHFMKCGLSIISFIDLVFGVESPFNIISNSFTSHKWIFPASSISLQLQNSLLLFLLNFLPRTSQRVFFYQLLNFLPRIS